MNHEKLDRLPDSLLTDITIDPNRAEQSQEAQISPISEVSPGEVMGTAKGAEIGLNDALSERGDAPKGAAAAATPTGAGQAGAKAIPLGGMLGGKMVTDMIDAALPALLVWAVSAIGYKLDRKALSLTDKEKEFINPYMQTYLDSVNVSLNNPLQNLMLVFGSVYAAKIIAILPTIEKLEKQKQKTAPVSTADEVKARIEKQKERLTETQKLIQEVSSMEREVALKVITDRRRKGKADAVKWYNENVKKTK